MSKGPGSSDERRSRKSSNGRGPSAAATTHELTTARLHVGNLSFDATESDLFELFNGVGSVRNAEVVCNKHTQRSKGFAFVSMTSVEEAKRAVAELHGKEFMGRKLIIGGARPDRESRSEEEPS